MFYGKQLALEFASEGWQGIPNMIGKLLKANKSPFILLIKMKARAQPFPSDCQAYRP